MEKIIPHNWKKSTIGEINLRKSENINPSEFPEEEFELYSVPIFQEGRPEILKGQEIQSSKQVVMNNEVLLCKINPRINRVWTVGQFSNNRKIASSEWIIIDTKNIISHNFLRYQFSAPFFRELMQSEVSGVGGSLTRARPKLVENYPCYLPPLPEQKRIVAKLDRLFAHLEALKARLDRIPALLAAFRQSVLTQAVTGKLTEEWREGQRNWEIKRVQDITTKVGSGATPQGGSMSYKSEGIPLIRSMNVHFGGIKFEGLVYLDDEQAKSLDNVKVMQNDVLLNITGASIGRVCVAPKNLEGARVNQHVTIIRVNENVIAQYLYLYLASPNIQNFINTENYGVTRQALTKSQILDIEISLPSLQEQQEIVRRIESLFARADAIEQRYRVLKEKIDQLPQAILAKAFRGELVAQLEGDGDAQALLEEVRRMKSTGNLKNKQK